MMYSVFNPDSAKYDYFQGVGPKFGERQLPRVRSLAGATPESVMPLLPDRSVRVGSGPEPRGVIAVNRVDVALGQAPATSGTFVQRHPWLSVGLAIGGVLLAYRLTLRAVR